MNNDTSLLLHRIDKYDKGEDSDGMYTHSCTRTDSRVCRTAIEIPIRDLLMIDSFIFLDDDDENHVLLCQDVVTVLVLLLEKQHARGADFLVCPSVSLDSLDSIVAFSACPDTRKTTY